MQFIVGKCKKKNLIFINCMFYDYFCLFLCFSHISLAEFSFNLLNTSIYNCFCLFFILFITWRIT